MSAREQHGEEVDILTSPTGPGLPQLLQTPLVFNVAQVIGGLDIPGSKGELESSSLGDNVRDLILCPARGGGCQL